MLKLDSRSTMPSAPQSSDTRPPAGRRAVDEIAARNAVREIEASVHCRQSAVWWTQMESSYEGSDSANVRTRLALVIERRCEGCPAIGLCAGWARVEKYTGFAAGVYFYAGIPRRRHRV